MSSAGTATSGSSATPMPGLINSAPGSSTTTPGATPAGNSGPGAPVTSYNPNQAAVANATSTPTTIPTNGTVQSQLQNIIASGSPLMEQAETNAKNVMNQRGLINSSQAITAGDNSVIAAATPIAQQDAATYATAAEQTAQAANAASLQNSSLGTQTSQFNAGQGNAALSQAATASNTAAVTAQQIAGQTTIQGMQDTVNQSIAQLQANTSLSTAQLSAATQQIVANIQANTSITNQQAQDLSQQVITQMNNTAALANIQANGQVSAQLATINNANSQLMQSDQAAQSFYSQSLVNLSNIINNTNLSDAQKTQALQDGVQELNDGLAAISQISGTPGVQSTLNFSDGTVDPSTGEITGPNVASAAPATVAASTPAPAPVPSPVPSVSDVGASNPAFTPVATTTPSQAASASYISTSQGSVAIDPTTGLTLAGYVGGEGGIYVPAGLSAAGAQALVKNQSMH